MSTEFDAKVIKAAWCRATSAEPERWSRKWSWWGQSDITALTIHDYVGGVILHCEIDAGMHYWNRTADDVEFDMVVSHLGEVHLGEAEVWDWSTAMREDLDLRARYAHMKRRVSDASWVSMIIDDQYSAETYVAEW